MKRPVFLFALLLAVPLFASAQSQSQDRKPNEPVNPASTAVRNRVVGTTRAANHAEKQTPNTETSANSTGEIGPSTKSSGAVNQNGSEAKWGNTAVVSRPVPTERSAPLGNSPVDKQRVVDQSNQPVKKLVQQTTLVSEAPKTQPLAGNVSRAKSLPGGGPAPTSVYHVGVGDVLDIRLTNLPTRESTLFTVLKNGALEYPLLSAPVSVAGMTPDDIAKLLSSEIKVLKSARVSVSVRDYASHAVLVSGLVDNPGRKILRREAMPLFAVLAEALPRSEASLATILRNGNSQTVFLNDQPAMSTLVFPGDAIKVSESNNTATRFVYVGGDVASRGEKEFRNGMTLTQAILTAGGVVRGSKINVKVARRDARGFLKTAEYSLQTIEEGKSPDPLLEAGDRIEVTRSM